MEKKTIELNVEATQATKALDKFGGTLEDVYGEGVQPLNFAIGELEDRLYELAAAGNKGSKEFKDIAAEVGRMKKVIIETDMEVDGLSMTMGQKLGSSLGGLAGGFELVQGTMGAMGVESAKVEEALLAVNSAMAMAQGVQGIKEALPAFGALKSGAVSAFQSMSTAGKAFAITGIGLILTALAAAVSAMESFTGSADESAEAQKKLEDSLEETNKQIERQTVLTSKLTDITDNATKKALIDAKNRGASDAELTKIARDGAKERLRILEEEEEAAKKLYIKKSKSGSQKEFEAAEKSMNDASKAASALRLQIQEDEANENLEKQRKNQEKQAQNKKLAAEKAFEKQKEQDLLEVQQMQLKTKALATIEIDTEKAKNEILAGLDAEEKAAAEQREKEHQEALKVMRERNAKFAVDTSIEAFSTIQALADAFAGKSEASQKKAFKIRKAAAIAQTVIETYKAAQGAYASQIIPGDPTSPIRGAIAATIAVASGLAKVKSIASQKFEGGGSSGGSGGGSAPSLPSSTPANFNIVGNSNTNQIVEGLNANPVQAFVVSGEVTSAQSLDRNRIKTATL